MSWWFTCVLSERVRLKTTIVEYIFYPTTRYFQVISVATSDVLTSDLMFSDTFLMSDVLATNLMLTGLILFSTFPLTLGRKKVKFMIFKFLSPISHPNLMCVLYRSKLKNLSSLF